ncbi:EamA-like transporter family protein [Mariniphaga anaerophila]|uniref:EamA-like transporter family protein n=1 Tax=Mariniphaga anaerophila TaxID=1484053 RepID=A0A1M4YL04_9BACT|nr:DMT family transporter [Mariniphaga anaerophila]SHF06327.1 EamA-like transporter family protein [Mariniphaga anaerophila]
MKLDTLKGYLFALVATIAFSNVYIFSKAALNEVHLVQFGVYWFSISTFLNLLYSVKQKKLAQLKMLSKKQVRILITLGMLEILTTTSFFLSIHIIPDPAVTSFLGNMFPVMLALGGVFILGEKFGPVEIIGAFLAMTGAFIISYTGGTSFDKFFIPGTGIVLINAFLATSASLVVKVHVKKMSPELLNLNRSVWLLIFSIVMFFVYGQSIIIPASAIKNIAIGALLGPFLAVLTVYYSFSFLPASKSSVVQSLKGIFVLVGAYLFFGTLPLKHQLIGGFLTVGGVLIMTLAQAGVFRKRVKES